MTKKEFRSFYMQVYSTCLDHQLRQTFEINKIKLMLYEHRGKQFIQRRLEEGIDEPYEPISPFYYDPKEIASSAQVIAEDFVGDFLKQLLTKEHKEWEECLLSWFQKNKK